MKYQPDHSVINSFLLWFDDHLLKNGEAYSNKSQSFQKTDPLVQDSNGIVYQTWITPKDQWIYDTSASGVVVPSGIYINNSFTTSVKLDFENGAALVPAGLNPVNVSGSYSAKDFETRITSANEESILFGDDPGIRFGDTGTENIPDQVGFPFVYLRFNPGKNEPLGLGGFCTTKLQIRAIVVADDSYLFDGINILFRDTSEKYFAIFNPEEMPFDEFGSLKNGSFDYRSIACNIFQTDISRAYYIKDVTISPFPQEVNSRIAKNAIGGFIDFHIESLGYPRARFV